MKTQLIATSLLAALAIGAGPAESLSQAEYQGLAHMRQEEKLARDVYKALGAKWGSRPFGNIEIAEQAHMDAALALLQNHNKPDPVKSDVPGKFDDKGFQALYDRLVAKGMPTRTSALQVGCEIEELDITDLRDRVKGVTQPDLKRLYANLEQGSMNHLRAYYRVLRRSGGDYTPTHLNRSEFDKIIGG